MKLEFHTKFKLHKKIYLRVRILNLGEVGIDLRGWFAEALMLIANGSKVDLEQDSQVMLVLKTIQLLKNDRQWLDLANTLTKAMDDVLGVRCIEAMETALTRCELSDVQMKKRAGRLRIWITDGLTALKIPKADRIPITYRPLLRPKRSPPRKMISDIASHLKGEARYPSSATPHENWQELRARELQRRTDDLDAIVAAAAKEMDLHQQRSIILEELLTIPSPSLEAMIRSVVQSEAVIPKWIRSIDIKVVASTYFRMLNDPRFWKSRSDLRIVVYRAREIYDYLEEVFNAELPRYRMTELMIPQLCNHMVLTAVLVALQAHTGWNCNTVLDLKRSNILWDGNSFTIQGFKSRTGDSSPIVEVRRNDATASQALNILIARHDWMLKNGWISDSQEELWLNSVSVQNKKAPEPYVGWGPSLRRFTDRHRLPHFSWEQIRVQKLSLIALGVGGAKAAQHIAGHLQFSTTARYLEHEVFERLWASINYEFQKRLAMAVPLEYAMTEFEKKKNHEKYKWLLSPIGDGSSCKSYGDPPEGYGTAEGVCAAKHCHDGDHGCPHRVIEVSLQSIESALRLRNFYRQHWTRIAKDNLEEFRKNHLTPLIFNQVLIHFLLKGPYRSNVKNIEKQLQEASNARI